MKTVAETIRELSVEHCRSGGLIMGQNLEAVQNVCNTVPVEEPNVQIMPTCEAAGIGMSIGAALSGRPVIHVIRFGSFVWLQSSPLVYYAARAKGTWNYDLPLFVRVSCDDAIGPTHSGVYSAPFVHMPGLKVVAPMTPKEYRTVWQEFQEEKMPVMVFEHRRSYESSLELPTLSNSDNPSVTIIAIGGARFAALDALSILSSNKIEAEVIPIWRLSSYNGDGFSWLDILRRVGATRKALIVDSTYLPCSLAEHIKAGIYHGLCGRQMKNGPGVDVEMLGMFDPPACNGSTGRGTPTASEIAGTVEMML